MESLSRLGSMNKIFIPSVQHTGTRFTIDFIEKCGNIKVTKLPELLDHWETASCVHAHIGDSGIADRVFRRWASFCRMIIPIRDPVLSLITAKSIHERDFDGTSDHSFLVDGFNLIASHDEYNAQKIYLPVDQHRSTEERIELLRRVADHLRMWVDGAILQTYATEWRIVNSCHLTQPMLDLYAEKGILGVKEITEEAKLLLSLPVIKDFLVSLDYKLDWFDLCESK